MCGYCHPLLIDCCVPAQEPQPRENCAHALHKQELRFHLALSLKFKPCPPLWHEILTSEVDGVPGGPAEVIVRAEHRVDRHDFHGNVGPVCRRFVPAGPRSHFPGMGVLVIMHDRGHQMIATIRTGGG